MRPCGLPTGGGATFFARWTSDFDCGYETGWWYEIKDTPLDLAGLKAKRRYEIRKGEKNFRVEEIDPAGRMDDFLRVTTAAYSGWPEKYRPRVDAASLSALLDRSGGKRIWGGFDRDSGALCGYAVLIEHPEYAEFSVLRCDPACEARGINAAMVAAVITAYQDWLGPGFYICDGARAIRHETAFQDYLEKYFDFRKAYCRLHIRYRFPVGLAVRVLYPFRRWISAGSGLGSQIAAVLRMEELARRSQNAK